MPAEKITVTAVMIDEYSKKLVKMGKDTDKISKGMNKSFAKVSSAAKGLVGAYIGVAGVQKFLAFSKEAIRLHGIQEQAEKKLEAVLKSTGHAAGLMAGELQKMSRELQQVTTFGDETILGAQSLMLTFTKIGKEVFPDAIETVLNMSAAMGTDLQSSVIQLGKALNDPAKGISALSRVGVAFTEKQKEMIKKFSETNQVAEAQKIILNELRTEFGGMARALSETPTGQLKQLENSLGDIQEKIGAGLVPAQLRWNKLLVKTGELLIKAFDLDVDVKIARMKLEMEGLQDSIDKDFRGIDNSVEKTTEVIEDNFEDIFVTAEEFKKAMKGVTFGPELPAEFQVMQNRIDTLKDALAGLNAQQEALKDKGKGDKPDKPTTPKKKKEEAITTKDRSADILQVEQDLQDARIAIISDARIKESEELRVEQQRKLDEYAMNLEARALITETFGIKEDALKTKWSEEDTKRDEESAIKRKTLQESVAKSTIGNALAVVSLFKDSSEEMFNLTKALSIAQAGMNTYTAVTAALKLPLPPPIPQIQAGVIFALGIAQVAKIAATTYKAQQGTRFSPGGRTLVGEAGPELIDAPRGSRIHTAQETRNITNNNQTNTNRIIVLNTQNETDMVSALEDAVQDKSLDIKQILEDAGVQLA